ncbi:MAG TPA: type IV pilus secretin PilQ [candidate division Zixibacteria bacterium]|jgi:type IV pilus secretin PilQ/predicted competence protein
MKRLRNRQVLGLSLPAIGLTVCALLLLAAPTSGEEIIKNLNFQNADVRSVLNFLAEYGGVNLVAAPNVQGQVTLNLKNVEWRQALEILAKTYGLKVTEENGFLRVLLLIDYLEEEAERERHLAEQRQLVDIETELFEIKHANAKDLIRPVKSLLSVRGKVDVEERTNTLLVSDEPVNLARAAQFIIELDRETRQVRISAKLLEVSSNYFDEVGVSWNLHGSGADNDGNTYTNDISTDGAEQITDPFGIYTFGTMQNGWDLDATVAAIVSSGHGKVVAHPEITTVDNKMARIQVGQKVPIKQFSATGDVVITFEEVGTILRVTPHITSDNRILLSLMPERSSFFFDPSGVVINTSNAETNVVVENGQTAVIGGLTTEDELKTVIGVPILKDIPLIGKLFSYEKNDTQKRDLVIFVTPEIVEPALMGAVDNTGSTNP